MMVLSIVTGDCGMQSKILSSVDGWHVCMSVCNV